MRFRKLRIAWSVMCLIACVLLIVLWVRSYWWADVFSSAKGYSVGSLRGELLVAILDDTTGFSTMGGGYSAEEVNEEFDQWNPYKAATPTWNVFFARGETLPG